MLRVPCLPFLRRPATIRRLFSTSKSRDWFGIESEYFSLRGIGIASRVFRGLPQLTRYIRDTPRQIFASQTSDEARSAMYVLSKFPMNGHVDLPEFVLAAEQVAHVVLSRLYMRESDEMKRFWEQVATSESLGILGQKPSVVVKRSSQQAIEAGLPASLPSSSFLEHLCINGTALEAVEYTRERVDEQVMREWMTIRVQYDVTEHLRVLLGEDGEKKGLGDRRVINTRFAWTFEAEVTEPAEVAWGIVVASPFEEKPVECTTI
uniref:Tim44-like domain-containing protein n=1 Tax=Peronospora matthiolae TaxID=2874970 RepID=A0AAV1TVK7_9STRA